MFDLGDLFLVSLFLIVGIFFWLGMSYRERTLRRVNQYLKGQGLQLLDQNIELKNIRLKRNRYQRFTLWYKYAFEFSSMGDDRYPGMVEIMGGEVTKLELAPYRVPEENEPLE